VVVLARVVHISPLLFFYSAMKSSAAVVVGLVACGQASTVTPVQKVIQLMNGMLEKGKSEKHDEQVQYAAYKQFCDDTSGQKKAAISDADEQIGILGANIEKYTSDAEQLAEEIAGHDEDIAVWGGDIKATTKVRGIEKADFDATHKDYSESIDAMERAISTLKGQTADRKQASLTQVSALGKLSLMPESAKQSIASFLSDSDSGIDVSAPEANAYEFQSGGIVDMLEGLLDKFIAKKTALEKEESESKQAFEMLLSDLTAMIARSTEERDTSKATKSKKLGKKASDEGTLKDTTEVRAEDQKYLDDLLATCEQKAADFESRQQLRTEEMEAIDKAIEIISSGAVSGAAGKHLPGSLVEVEGSSLSQLRAGGVQLKSQEKVAEFLQGKAKQLNSRVLAVLAVRVAEDPFVKVRKMIKDLIVKLMDEANGEAEHKGWCDKELATNEQTRTEKTNAVEELTSQIEELQASIAKETEDLAGLSTALSQLEAAMEKATMLRGEEKDKNAATVKDAQEAQTAVAQALTVLEEFYAKASEATALVQEQDEQEPPPSPDGAYKGMGDENGGVVGMLEVIQSDFARLESETEASEAAAQKEYDTFMSDSKIDKEGKSTDEEHKTAKKNDEEAALGSAQEDLEATQKELVAAMAYFDKLKPSCVEADVSYEDRVAAREAEIESLQEALKILNGDSI